MWADAHCHLQDWRLERSLPGLLDVCRQKNILRWVVNSTREEDWPRVQSLCRFHPGVLGAYGLHPWWIHQRTRGWRHRLHALLENTPGASIGEAGLDLWMPEANLADQQCVLKEHLELAAELRRPVSLHCLKAWPQLLETLEKTRPLPAGFLLHSYAGPVSQIPRWVDLGAYFSFSPAFLAPKRVSVREMFAHFIPPDRLLVETDSPDMAPPPELCLAEVPGAGESPAGPGAKRTNHPLNLLLCAEELARLLGLSTEAVQGMLWENFQRLFGRERSGVSVE